MGENGVGGVYYHRHENKYIRHREGEVLDEHAVTRASVLEFYDERKSYQCCCE